MSAMGESKYLLSAHTGQNRHPQHSPQDLAPNSAVSSFNLPSYCDSSLITPISMTRSPSMTTKTASALKSDRDIKLSPSTISPAFQFMASDDEYTRYNNNPPMKYKNPSGALQMSSADSSFPVSPYICPEPFWGAYGVSATPVSGRSESSPSGNPSPPQMHSAGSLSNTSSPYSRQQTSAQNSSSYRNQNPAPILIAPSPSILRPATNPSRQNSLQSISTVPSSATMAQGSFPEPVGSLPPRGKKRKSPSRDSKKTVLLDEESAKPEDKFLLDLTHKQHTPWKVVVNRFMEKFPGSKEITQSTLQMRKKRLVDRLRVWTEEDKRALAMAVEEVEKNRWDQISDKMLAYGCKAKWPKELCQRKWQELNPEDGTWFPQYEMSVRCRDSEDWGPDDGAFSDGRASACRSLHEGDSGVLLSAGSTATMEEVRSRAASDAGSHMLQSRCQSQQQQQQLMFDHQQQHHNGWDPEA